MTIKSVNSPAIGQEGINRLLAATDPKRIKPTENVSFQAGYEQAKADLRELVVAEVGRPARDVKSAEMADRLTAAERAARKAELKSRKAWWHL